MNARRSAGHEKIARPAHADPGRVRLVAPYREESMNHLFGRAAVLRAALLTTGSTYISFVLGLLVSVLVARSLGPDDYGRYAYVVWLAGILVMLSNNGLTSTGIKFVSECLGRQDSDGAARVHGWLRRQQMLCIGVVGVFFLCVIPFIKPSGWTGHLWVLICTVQLAAGVKALSMFNTSIAKGYGVFTIEALTNLVASVSNAVAAGMLAWLHAPTFAYVVMFAMTSVIYLTMSHGQLRRRGVLPGPARPAADLLERLKPHLWWTVGLTAITAIGSKSVDTLLLNAWVGAADVGYYAIAQGLTRGGVELLVSGLSAVAMPLMGYAFGSGEPARIRRVFEDTTRYYQFLGLIIAGVGWFWSDVVVNLMYGSRYATVVPVLRIMVISSGMLLANGAASAVLTNSDNQRFRVMVTLLSFALSASIAVALIPRFGVIGAALAQTGASVVSSLVLIVGIRKYVGLDAPWLLLMRQYVAALLAALLGFGLVWLAGARWGAWLAGPVYALGFVVLSLFLGVWRPEEVGHLDKYVDRYPGVLGWLRRFMAPAASQA